MNTGMAWSVLTEVHTLLGRLASHGETAAIDLRSLPLTEADRAELEALLGAGEVRCSLELMGRTEVWETAYTGVWWVRHRGAQDRVASEELAITTVPDILQSHPADIVGAAARLGQRLAAGASDDTTQKPEASDG
jgi:hydrogenase-1 operon protein HyaF